MYSTVTTDTSIQTRVLFTSNHQISRAVESSLLLSTRIIYNSNYNCFINSDSITTELSTKKKKHINIHSLWPVLLHLFLAVCAWNAFVPHHEKLFWAFHLLTRCLMEAH